MQYRKFGKLDFKVSALGFGCMRLPVLNNNMGQIDEKLAIRMIRYAIDNGVNYVDTAYPYHQGKSESLVGVALGDGYRQKVKLATKLFVPAVQTAKDFDRLLNEQLGKLQTDHVDFYLLHSLTKDAWPKLRNLDVLNWAEGAIKDGRIGYLGFSFHDEFPVFKEIVDAYNKWTFCQIQYNYADINYQAGVKGLKYAASKGLAVSIMEPIRGGAFTKKQPEQVAKLFASAPVKRSPAEWALLWVMNQPEVSVVLSGMSAWEHVVENVKVAGKSGVNILTPVELKIIEHAGEMYRNLTPVPCTGCRYCMDCKQGVDIPKVLALYNDVTLYGSMRSGFMLRDLPQAQGPEACIECGECVDKCPQHIAVPAWMKKARDLRKTMK